MVARACYAEVTARPANCDVILPHFPLSILGFGGAPLDSTPAQFGISDCDPLIRRHVYYWLICLQASKLSRSSNVEGFYLLYADEESCVYIKRCLVIIAFRGTKHARDLYDDALISLGTVYPRVIHAVRFIQRLLALNPHITVHVTGHSLGGAIARDVGKTLRLKTVTFNAAAPPTSPVSIGFDEVSYHVVFDLISAWQSPNVIRIDKGFRPSSPVLGLVVPGVWLYDFLNSILPAHKLSAFSNATPGTLTSAADENYYFDRWYYYIPHVAKILLLTFFLGSSSGTTVGFQNII